MKKVPFFYINLIKLHFVSTYSLHRCREQIQIKNGFSVQEIASDVSLCYNESTSKTQIPIRRTQCTR